MSDRQTLDDSDAVEALGRLVLSMADRVRAASVFRINAEACSGFRLDAIRFDVFVKVRPQ